MDVLYLIAIALPATYFFVKLSTKTRWITVGLIFLLAPILQMIFGYTPQPLYISLIHGTVIYADIPGQTGIINHWFIDGWFPIFPWLGFAFLGANLGIMRFKDDRIVRPPFKRTLFYGISAIAAGILMYALFPTAFYVREGFSEFIYPPTLAYILIATGQILILLALIDVFHSKKIFAPLIVLGESSLFVYIMHYALIDFMPMNPSMGLLWALGIGSVLVLFALSYVLRHLRRKYPDRPFALRYVLGA